MDGLRKNTGLHGFNGLGKLSLESQVVPAPSRSFMLPRATSATQDSD